MTDREKVANDRNLLKLAAKAANYPLIESTRRLTKDKYFEIIYNAAGNRATWNPLTDDGDALRLAVKLELRLATHCNHEMACASDIHGRCKPQVIEWKADPYAATRRAIVRAAAEIGKELK